MFKRYGVFVKLIPVAAESRDELSAIMHVKSHWRFSTAARFVREANQHEHVALWYVWRSDVGRVYVPGNQEQWGLNADQGQRAEQSEAGGPPTMPDLQSTPTSGVHV